MLYDPKWEKKNDPKFKGIALSALTAWLATKPADDEYDYIDDKRCALAQYRRSLGRKRVRVDLPLPERGAPGEWLQNIVLTLPWTFGAALERARAVLAQHKRTTP